MMTSTSPTHPTASTVDRRADAARSASAEDLRPDAARSGSAEDHRAASAPGDSIPRPRPAGVLAAFVVLVLAMLPAVLDQTVLATALPTVAAQLGSIGDVSTIVTAYVLASTASTPLWGKLGDRHGRRPLLGAALMLFLAASAACGLAQTLGQLIAFRAVQGVAAGGLMSLAMASVGDLVEPRQRARWQGRIAAVFAGATVVGPLVGGLLVEHASWRWVFYVNLPVGLAALVGVRRFLPEGTRAEPRLPLDLAGAGLLAAATAAALLVLGWGGGKLAWTSPELLALAGVALICAIGFALRERRATDPVVPLAMLRLPTVRVAAAGLFLVTASLFAVTVFVPVLLQVALGISPTKAGLVLATMTIGMTIVTAVAGRRVARTGRLRRLPVLGAAVMAAALGGLSLVAPSASAAPVIALLVVFGGGFGLTSQLLVVAVQNGVERTRIGVATSATSFFRAFGGSAGAAGLGAVFAGAGHPVGDAVRVTFAVAAAIAACAAAVLAALPADVDRRIAG
jgi:EmrB/QacA subfamily drug resistance transporter